MATLSSPPVRVGDSGRRLGVLRVGATGAVTSAVVFVLCWIGTFIPFASPTHAFISLFTPAPIQSVDALLEGGLWSLLFGGLSGGLFALLYNLFGSLDPR